MIRSRWAAAGLLAAALLVGAVAGVAAHAAWGRRAFVKLRHPDPEMAVRHLSRELDLSPSQRDSVRAALERARPALDSIWSDCRPRFQAVQQRLTAEIAAQLDSTQRRKFETLRQRFERMRPGPGGPPGPPPPPPPPPGDDRR